jgi:hypothetical protein
MGDRVSEAVYDALAYSTKEGQNALKAGLSQSGAPLIVAFLGTVASTYMYGWNRSHLPQTIAQSR